MLETGETVFNEVLHGDDAEPRTDGASRRA
jgi:hypothetical protein